LVPFGGAVTQPFVVPQGYALVLTDVVVSPQSFPPTGDFTWLVTSQPSPVTTAYLLVTSSAAEPSSFQVHLTTGMSFPAGSGVGVTLGNGGSSLNVSAFGYLAPKASAR